mgnify:FL=1|tara:strand:- start:413 stop:1435 length:1023 start_codon:yes stop_codon:yes gene_type:complete
MIKKYTIQPLFSYKNLFKSIFSLHKKKYNYLFKSGRHSLYHALKFLNKSNKIKKILLPSLICNEIIPVIKELGLDINYYKIKQDLSFDTKDIELYLQKEKSFFLFVNYFGSTYQHKLLKEIKVKYNCIIIEDNAHTLTHKNHIREAEDIISASFNSLRKILPLLSGSELIINNDNCNIYNKITRFPNIGEIAYSLRWLKIPMMKNFIKPDKTMQPKKFEVLPIDYFSRRILEKIKVNFTTIRERRIRNYLQWKKYLSKHDLNLFEHIHFNESMIPYAFPCLATSDKSVKYWIKWGQKYQINIIKWPDIPYNALPLVKKENLDKILLFPINDQFDLTHIIN